MRELAIGAMCLALASCDTPNFRTAQFEFGESRTLAATGNLRFVSERHRLLPRSQATVVCSEPSPDYATASGTDASGTIKLATTAPVTDGNLSLKTTEQVSELQGRSKGVLALRDGLYAACQAYANGLIGKDAYSIILSQYGLLLVAVLQDQPTVTVTGDAAKKATYVRSTPVKVGSAFAAMLVSCINQFDPTRRDYPPEAAPYDGNPLLTEGMCRDILKRAGTGARG